MISYYSATGRRKTKTEIMDSYYAQFKVKCRCGHSVLISPVNNKKLCTHCGNYVYRDKKEEFMEKLEYARKNI